MTRAAARGLRAVTGRLRSLPGRMRGDQGMSLVELLVGMVLMAVFMAMFTGGVVSMTKAMNTSQAVNDAAAEVNTAFTRLDETVRSASYISTPGQPTIAKNWYVELQATYTGAEVCTQLTLDRTTRVLQSRTWTVTGGVAVGLTGWKAIASGFTNGNAPAGAANQPFALSTTNRTARLFQQLVVTLVPPAGPGNNATTAGSSFTVTALNSTQRVPTASICQQAGRP